MMVGKGGPGSAPNLGAVEKQCIKPIWPPSFSSCNVSSVQQRAVCFEWQPALASYDTIIITHPLRLPLSVGHSGWTGCAW